MRRELGIAERTYRKYRRVLREDFTPFVQHDGKTSVMELETGGARYLRLVDIDAAGVSDPEFDARVAAVYLAQAAVSGAAGKILKVPMNDLVSQFEIGLRDRAFVQSRVLDQADRMFGTEYPENGADNEMMVRAVLRGLIHRRELLVAFEPHGETMQIKPYTLVMGATGLSVIGETTAGIRRVEFKHTRSAEVTAERFEYPSRVAYDPKKWLQKPS